MISFLVLDLIELVFSGFFFFFRGRDFYSLNYFKFYLCHKDLGKDNFFTSQKSVLGEITVTCTLGRIYNMYCEILSPGKYKSSLSCLCKDQNKYFEAR